MDSYKLLEGEEAGAGHHLQEDKKTRGSSSLASVAALLDQDVVPASEEVHAKRLAILISILGSFSTAYNVLNISLAMVVMKQLYPQTQLEEQAIGASLFAGMVIGQLGFGFIGDAVGVAKAFQVTIILQVVGAVLSALVVRGPTIYLQLAIWRFLLGVGAGGVYPLSAAYASSSSDKGSSDSTVALVFSLQGVAFVAVNLLGVLLAATTLDNGAIFRVFLGLGAVPGLVIFVLKASDTYVGHHRAPPSPTRHTARGAGQHVMQALRDPLVLRRLFGCSITWLLYDVCFFGNAIFSPIVLGSIFGETKSLERQSVSELVVSCTALPGYFLSVLTMKRLGPRWIQTQGFVVCAALYLIMAVFGQRLTDAGLGPLVLVIYGLSFCFFNFGPGATTFLYPAKLFDKDIKSTLNGIAAAAGKIGGFAGSYFFPEVEEAYGLRTVLLSCSAIALVGAMLTVATLDDGNHQFGGWSQTADHHEMAALPLNEDEDDDEEMIFHPQAASPSTA